MATTTAPIQLDYTTPRPLHIISLSRAGRFTCACPQGQQGMICYAILICWKGQDGKPASLPTVSAGEVVKVGHREFKLLTEAGTWHVVDGDYGCECELSEHYDWVMDWAKGQLAQLSRDWNFNRRQADGFFNGAWHWVSDRTTKH